MKIFKLKSHTVNVFSNRRTTLCRGTLPPVSSLSMLPLGAGQKRSNKLPKGHDLCLLRNISNTSKASPNNFISPFIFPFPNILRIKALAPAALHGVVSMTWTSLKQRRLLTPTFPRMLLDINCWPMQNTTEIASQSCNRKSKLPYVYEEIPCIAEFRHLKSSPSVYQTLIPRIKLCSKWLDIFFSSWTTPRPDAVLSTPTQAPATKDYPSQWICYDF